MGVVKYSGPVASFHCPTEATIGSLKVHFSPKQLGSGTPSPENVREIVGWDGVEVNHNNSLYCDGDYPYIEVPDGLNIGDKIVAYVKQPKGITGEHGFMGVQGAIGNAFELYYLGSELKVWPSDMTLINTEYGDIDIITCKATVAKTKPYKIGVYRTDKYKYIGYIYRVTIYNSAEERIRDFIPYKQNDVIGFYDNVKKEFFTPASTSKFKNYTGEIINYEFGVLGKNKLDYSAVTTGHYIDGNGVIQSDQNFVYSIPMYLSSTTYTFSGTNDYNDYGSTNVRIHGYATDGSWIKQIINQTTALHGTYSLTFTVPEDVTYIRISMPKMDDAQLELGSTATAYEPYDPNNTVYGGWVDLISGEVCEEYATLTTTKNGVITGVNDFGDNCYRIIFNFNVNTRANGWNAKGYCDKYARSNKELKTSDDVNKFYFYYVLNSQAWKVMAVVHSDTPITNAEEAKTYLETNNFALIYELFTPMNTYHLAPTQLHTFLAQNNVWSNADYVEVEYDLHETQNILARKQFIIANQPHIESASGNFVTDMAALLKECKVGFEPIQEGSGDPSPENVRPISGWTGLSLYHSGENLYIPNPDNKGYINVRGEIKVDTTSTYTDLIPVTAGETYSFKCTTVSVPKGTTNRRLHGYDSNGNWVMQITNRTTAAATVEDVSIVVTIPSGVSYIRASFRNQDTNVRVAKENAVSVNWETEAGTVYGGYVDLVSGEVVAEWYKVIADGVNVKANSSYMTDNYIAAGIVYLTPNGVSSANTKFANNILCNIMPVYSQNYLNNHRDEVSYPYASATNAGQQYTVFYLANRADHPEVTDATSCKNFVNAWLQEHPATLIYELRTPITYQINPTILKTLRGLNNIWSNANGNIELKYWTH